MHREPQPVKLYTQATMYRYAAPQKGRYREHWQQSVEAIGSDDPARRRRGDPALQRSAAAPRRDAVGAPAELDRRPQLSARDTSSNSRRGSTRTTTSSTTTRARSAQTSPLRVFDVKNPKVRDALADAPKIGDSLCDECREHFAAVRSYLDAYGVPYTLEPTLVRGLDYYTRTTFEFVGPDEGVAVDDLRRRPLRRPGRGDRRPGDARHRLRRRDRAAARRAPQRGDHGRTARARTLLPDRAGRRPREGARGAGKAPGRGRGVRRRLRRPLDEGPAHAARTLRRARLRPRSRRRRDDQARRRRAGGSRRRGRGYGARMNEWRDLRCGEVPLSDVGERLTLAGWAARRRDHGGLVFIDLRDHTGLMQLVINPERAPEAAKVAHEVRNEFVLRARGRGRARARPKRSTRTSRPARSRCRSTSCEIVSRSEPLPFQLDEENVDENTPPPLPLARPAQRPDAAQPPAVRHRRRGDPPLRWTRSASSTSGRRT